MRETIGVLGAGSWGTALAVHLASAGFGVRLWARRRETFRQIERERCNAVYLPDVLLSPRISVTTELADFADCREMMLVVPSHGFREVLRNLLAARPPETPLKVVSATKGIETESLARMSGVVAEEGERAGVGIAYSVLSGPTFAAELASGVPSVAVIASHDAALAAEQQQRFSSANLRLYSSTDVTGVEIAGAAKNVIAIAAGIIHGLGLGHNTLAALITRGLHEITRLGLVYGGEPRTFAGLAGLGDLVLTCTGGLSRNRRTGIELAAGKTLEQIERESSMVAEGIRNSRSISRLARRREIELPIIEQMMGILYGGVTPREAVSNLMTRALKEEGEF